MTQSLNKVIELLYLAKQDGVELVLNEKRLQIKIADDKVIDEKLLQAIRNNKQEIIDYLCSENWQVTNILAIDKIGSFNRDEVLQIPLSFSQERLWFIDQLEGSVQYHSPSVMRLKGNLNIDALSDSLKTVIGRHDILRTIFREEEGKVYQSVKEKENWILQFIDGSKYLENSEARRRYLDELIKLPFDLSKDYPVRGMLIRLSTDEHVLVVTMHHIASDAWSISIIVREVVELYNSFIEGRKAILADLPLQYADYAVWQRNYLQGEVLEKKITYWKQKLEGLAALELPTDFPRTSVRGTKGAAAGFRIDRQITTQLQELSRQQGATLFMVLLATFKVLLQRYSGQQDISVGTSIASRQQKELEGLIGFFVNTLVLRDEVNGASSFTELLQQVKQTTLEAYEHQELPFEKVVETVVKERDMSRSPLFQVMLVLQNTPEASKLRFGDVELSGEPFTTNISKFDISFFINETAEGLQGSVEYSTDLYEAATIQRMTAHFENLLRAVVNNPQEKIGRLRMLKSEEQQKLLEAFNNSVLEYPINKSIIDLFEAQVAITPENAAIIFEKETLSYRQLNERSNQLAHYLQSKGITKDSLVPLYIERSASMMVGMVGIMKAGAAYVPVDTDFPQERIGYMLKDTGAKIIVSSNKSAVNLGVANDVEIIEIENVAQLPKDNLPIKPLPGQLAYVIYTSGSTGQPKGVMIEHKSLVDYYYGLNKHTQIGQSQSFALVSTIATDLGNTVIYASLLSGGALHIFTKESVSNIEYLHDYFAEQKIDCLKIVPSHWKALSNDGDLLLPKKLLVFGGEALPTEFAQTIQTTGSSCRVVNHYGPTETTIGKLLHEVKPGNNYNRTIPIGKPFSNTKVYVLSKELQLCPLGIPGQLYIAGDGVARGYYNNKAFTKEKFITNPFSQKEDSSMYCTGDLVKWLSDGNIEFIGRVDDQVKIRGYRIELGEIEAILKDNEEVSEAVVLAKEDKQGNKRLIAYIVVENDFDKEAINAYLKISLPEYMIPQVLVEMESLPLTANGKIDRKALPDPDTVESTADLYTAARNETEERLAAIWADVLEVEQVGVHDDFFELGGHSLLAVRLVSAIRKSFKVEMPIGDIFEYPTIALLATQIVKPSEASLLPPIQKAVPRPERIPLSFSQERLWFIDQLNGSVQYHIPAVLRLQGKLHVDALSNAMQQIINRHEVLRTVVLEEEGSGYQFIKEKNSWKLQTVDGIKYKDDVEGLHLYIRQFINFPFNLFEDYMLRAVLVSVDEEEHVLIVTLHHIASDGWSSSIIVKELVELYNAYLENRTTSLIALPIQYADFALWQRKYLQGEVFDKKLAYWKSKLEDVPALQLPIDYPRQSVQSTNGAITQIKIDKSLLDQLGLISRQQGTTLFMTLLAALKVLLYRYSGQRDICVGTPVAGRQQQEVEGLVGFFINTLALRSELSGEISFMDFLQQVRATTLEAYMHQEIPFEKVVESVVKNRDMSRSPLFQVMIVLQNTPEIGELRLGDVLLSGGVGESFPHNTSKFELTFNFFENVQGLWLSVEYCTGLFSELTIKRMMYHFTRLLNSVVKDIDQRIGQMPMLDSLETRELLVDFNNTKSSYPESKTIIEIFEEQVKKSPLHVALIFEGEQLTYQQLNERANQMARYLQSRGVKRDMMVPVCIERGIEMLIGIMGILKAGAAYVPIDANYPLDRISFMLEDISATLVLVSNENSKKLAGNKNIDVIEIDKEWPLISRQSNKNLLLTLKPSGVAIVIYTSGSTGQPKGVMVTQGNVVSLVIGVDYVDLNYKHILLSTGSPSFDATTFEYWGMLLNGGSLVLCAENRLLDSKLLKEEINSRGVNIMWFTSGWFNQLVEADITLFENLETILVGGEKLSEYHVEKVRQTFSGIKIINGYGPTENTTFSLTYSINEHEINQPIPIGRPLSNRSALILDENYQLVPVGVSGEIYLGGAGVSAGYLNRTELTKEKFLPHPYSEKPDAKIYRTGDVGRWLSNGNIEFLGRKDEQVKVRGYRIELGEIETVLEQSELVSKAVVLAKQDKEGNNCLIAYVVPKEIFHKESLLAFLKTRLPEYMVPAVLVKLKDFPLTKNGKIDRNTLPNPDVEELLSSQYVAPRNELEVKLANIWKEILLLDQVGVHDNFFEVGGHSLNAIRVAAVIRKRMDLDIFVNDIFIYPTIGSMIGNLIEKIKNPSLPDVNIKYLVPLNSLGNKVPLYIVAGGGGTANRFKNFCMLLGNDQPAYVLQAPVETTELKGFPDTIEGIAGKFLEEVLIQNPKGPYALSGHCLGGVIAFEMAHQLVAMGKKVLLLALFDTIIQSKKKPEPGRLKNLYHLPLITRRSISKLALKVNFETFLLTKHTRQSVRYKMNSLRTFLKKKMVNKSEMDSFDQRGLEIFNESADVYVNANRNYILLPYNADLVAFYAKEHYYFLDKGKNVEYKKLFLDERTKNMWKKYAANVFIHEIEGEHSAIFDIAHSDKFAQVLQQYLNNTPAEDVMVKQG